MLNSKSSDDMAPGNQQPDWIFQGLLSFYLPLLVYGTGLILYRLFWHPLAKYPGPKLAAATQWYEAYYSIFKHGRFPFQIQDLHKQYGPVIRINPHEIHIDDPVFYEILFNPTDVVDKLSFHTDAANMPGVVSFTVSGELHRPLRRAVAPFFTRAKVLDFAAETGPIRSSVKRLSQRLRHDFAGKPDRPVDIRLMLASMATDMIWEMVFCQPSDFLDSPDFGHPFPISFENMIGITHWNSHFPWLMKILDLVPQSLMIWALPAMKANFEWRAAIEAEAKKVMNSRNQESLGHDTGKTLVDQLNDPKLPKDLRTTERITIETINMVGASMGTVVWVMASGIYYILANPDVRNRLQKELKDAIPDDCDDLPDLRELEKLEYLKACMDETLRLGFGNLSRLTRVRPHQTIVYGDYVFPPGTPLGMDVWHMHTNETLFPEPLRFDPQRWLKSSTIGIDEPLVPGGVRPQKERPLSHYMQAFSTGTRSCFGDHLSRAVMTLTFVNLFRQHVMHLHESTSYERDVKVQMDKFLARPSKESKGIFVVIDK